MCEKGMPPRITTLKILRTRLGVKQAELARKMYTSHSRVSHIENAAPWDAQVRTIGNYLDGLDLALELWVRMPDGSRIMLQVDKMS